MKQLRLRPPRAKALSQMLLLVVLALVAFSLAGQFSKYVLGHDTLKGFVPLFYVDYESNVPTWYSSIALFLAAVLLGFIAFFKTASGDRFRLQWAALAVFFLCLSADEVAMLHEYPIDPLRTWLGAGGVFYYAWVIPGIAVCVLFGLAFRRFLFHLPARTRLLFVAAAAVYVGGAIGVEMLSGWQADHWGEENMTYALIITLEEAMEMLGVVIFIHALAGYLADHVADVRIQFTEGEAV